MAWPPCVTGEPLPDEGADEEAEDVECNGVTCSEGDCDFEEVPVSEPLIALGRAGGTTVASCMGCKGGGIMGCGGIGGFAGLPACCSISGTTLITPACGKCRGELFGDMLGMGGRAGAGLAGGCFGRWGSSGVH